MINKLKKISNSDKFLIGIIGIYIFSYVVDANYTKNAFFDFVKNFYEIIPILALAFAIIFLVDYFIKAETIKKHLGQDSGWKGIMYALVAPIIISGPPYVLYPIFGQFKKQGMKSSLIAIFFNNRNVNPVFVPVMIYYFGLSFTIVMSIYILIFAIIGGIIIEKINI